jgi:hypothetical protein
MSRALGSSTYRKDQDYEPEEVAQGLLKEE